MPLIPFRSLTSPGFVYDSSPRDLPPNVWTTLRNVRAEDNGLRTLPRDVNMGTLSAVPTSASYVDDATTGPLYLYSSNSRVYALQNGTSTDITRSSGTYSNGRWTFCNFNGVFVLNNGEDIPQLWSPVDPGTSLVDLPNWPSGVTAGVLRSYLNYLIALNVKKSGTVYDQMVKWSHYADPGSIPTSWDIADATKDSGEYSLAFGSDPIVDCLTMGSTNVLYKRDSIWMMRFIGGVQVFRFDPVVSGFGALSVNCAVALPDGSHLVLGRGDLCLFDGQGIKSIVTSRVKKWLFSRIDGTNYSYVYLAHNPFRREVFVCVPRAGNLTVDEVLVWNYLLDSFSTRILPNVSAIAYGEFQLGSGDTFDAASGDIDTDTSVFDSLPFNPSARHFSFFSSDQNYYLADVPGGGAETPGNAILERVSLPLDVSQNGAYSVRFTTRKLVTEVWPMIDTVDCPSVSIYVGAQEASEDAIAWSGPYIFNPLVDEFLPVWVNAKIISIRFEFPQEYRCTLLGYDLKCEILGRP